MHLRADIVYSYDGTYEGLMCCVHESFYAREMPASVVDPAADQLPLFPTKSILTDSEKASRVIESVVRRISPDIERFVWQAYLSSRYDKEVYIIKFLRMAFKRGPSILNDIIDDTVDVLTKAVRNVSGEAHLLSGFIRFSDYNGVLVSVIDPNGRVLPLIADHFCDRFQGEAFLIYDERHREALIHQMGERRIVPLESLELADPTEAELRYRRLWRAFYNTIGIEERYNPKCRMGHLPKRYWKHMTEFQGDEGTIGLGNTSGAVPIANGGTGATTAAAARTNLGMTLESIDAAPTNHA